MQMEQKRVNLETTPCLIMHSVIQNCFYDGSANEFTNNQVVATTYTGAAERMAGIEQINKKWPDSIKRPALLIFHYLTK